MLSYAAYFVVRRAPGQLPGHLQLAPSEVPPCGVPCLFVSVAICLSLKGLLGGTGRALGPLASRAHQNEQRTFLDVECLDGLLSARVA